MTFRQRVSRTTREDMLTLRLAPSTELQFNPRCDSELARAPHICQACPIQRHHECKCYRFGLGPGAWGWV